MPPSNSNSDKAANEPPSKSHVVWETFPTGDQEKEFWTRVAPDKADKFVYITEVEREAEQPVVNNQDNDDENEKQVDRKSGMPARCIGADHKAKGSNGKCENEKRRPSGNGLVIRQ